MIEELYLVKEDGATLKVPYTVFVNLGGHQDNIDLFNEYESRISVHTDILGIITEDLPFFNLEDIDNKLGNEVIYKIINALDVSIKADNKRVIPFLKQLALLSSLYPNAKWRIRYAEDM